MPLLAEQSGKKVTTKPAKKAGGYDINH